MKEKKLYVSPKVEIITLNEDVILTSGNDWEAHDDGYKLDVWGGQE